MHNDIPGGAGDNSEGEIRAESFALSTIKLKMLYGEVQRVGAFLAPVPPQIAS